MKNTIKPPKNNNGWGRAIMDAIIQAIPFVGGAVSRLTNEAIPTKQEKSRNEWEGSVTERVNNTSDRVDEITNERKQTITGLKAEILEMCLKECPDGLRTIRYDLVELCEKYPNHSRKDVEAAVHDLDAIGLVDMSPHLGGWTVRLSNFAYEQCDVQVMGWKPHDDAKVLANTMIEKDTGVASELLDLLGWSKRRFNPAQRIIVGIVPDGSISRNIQPDFVTMYISLAPQTKAILRRFIEG